MKNDELIKRYIYAATKNLPVKIRADVANELESVISDMLDGRCGEVEPTEKDIRVVLTELGTPDELAEKYNPDSDKCLIGSPYYIKYLFVLKIALISTAFGMAVAGFVTSILGAESIGYEQAALQWLGMIFNGLVSAFAFVTLIFAIFYHKGIKIDTKDVSLDNLPPVPKNTKNISKWEPIFGISFSVIFAVIFLAAPQIFCAVFPGSGGFVPIFNLETIRNTQYIIIALAVVGIAGECFKLIEGRHTYRLMAATIIADLITGALSIAWLTNDQLINPQFSTSMVNLFDEGDAVIETLLANPQQLLLIIILFSLAIDMITTVFDTVKSR